MACFLHCIFHVVRSRRMASVALIATALFSPFLDSEATVVNKHFHSQKFTEEALECISHQDTEALKTLFDRFEKEVPSSKELILAGRQFLECFLQEVNQRFGQNLTIADAIEYSYEALRNSHLPKKEKKALATLLKSFYSESLLSPNREKSHLKIPVFPNKTYIALQKTKQEAFTSPHKLVFSTQNCPDSSEGHPSDEDFPASVYVGSVELLGGGLTSILGMAFPPAYGIGGLMIGDGLRRIGNGLEEMDCRQSDEEAYEEDTRGEPEGFYEQSREF